MKKQKLQPVVAINEFTVEGIGIRGAASAVAWAQKKGYGSGHTFTHEGRKVRVWLSGHYQAYYDGEEQ